MDTENVFSNHEPFSPCFGMLKMRYSEYDESLSQLGFLSPYDKINVFINMEGAFKHVSMIHEVNRRVIMYNDLPEIVISAILNLAAHYKRFFVGYGLDTRIYMYQTSFDSTEFPQFKYNDAYRSYYLTKFNDNPRFAGFTDIMKFDVFPDLKTYCDFIPGVYYIDAKDIEGSVVPYVIAQADATRKNLVISGEFFDTQYGELNNFIAHYIHRYYKINAIGCSPAGYLHIVTKKEGADLDYLLNVYGKRNFYIGLLAVLGDRPRSIDGMTGVGPRYFADYVKEGLFKQVITENVTSPEMIADVFTNGEDRQTFIQNYYCSDVVQIYNDLTDAQKKSILNQIRDRSDNNALYEANHTRFSTHPIVLEGLLC